MMIKNGDVMIKRKSTYLLPGMRLDLREFEFGVIGIHFANLVAGGCAKNLDDLDQLVHTAVAREDRLTQ